MAVPPPDNPAEWESFMNQVKAIEKKDSTMTSEQQIERLHKPGAKYLNLNPFYVLQVEADADEDAIKKQYRRLSILLHPDKNPDNKDRASNAFEVVNKANKMLKEKETVDKFRYILADAKNRVIKMIEDKRKVAKSKGLPVPEDDPARFGHLVNVMASKQLADFEMRRDAKDSKDTDDKKREAEDNDFEVKRMKQVTDDKKKWEDTREERVTSWKDFVDKGKKKKKNKTKLGSFKPPKPRLEERTSMNGNTNN